VKSKATPKRLRPKVSEQASDWVEANYYVTIGLTRRQRSLLRETAVRWGANDQPCAWAARMLVMIGLASLPIIEKMWKRHADYCFSRDVSLVRYLDGLACSALSDTPSK